MNTLKTIDDYRGFTMGDTLERLRDAEKLKQSLNKLKALRKQWDYERQDFEKIEPMGDEELFKIELRVMSQMLNDEKNEGDLRLARLILRLHKAEKTLEALRDKLGSEEFVKSEFIRININDIPKNLQHTMEYQLMISPELKEAVDSETPHGKMLICARLVFDAIREHAAIKAMGV
jgi:hypothetical protein